MRFKLSHPTLVIIVLGFVLIIREPFDDPPPKEVSAGPAGDDTPTPTKPPETVQPPTTDAGAGPPPGSSSAPAADAAAPVADSSAATAADQSTPVMDRKAVDVAQGDAADAAAAAAAAAADAAAPASAATNAAESKVGQSTSVSTPALPRQATPAVPSPSSAWVYLGSLNGESLPSSTFKLTQLPVPGQEIEAITPVNTRAAAPALKEDKKWYFGRVVGSIKRGERVSVRRVETIRMTEGEPEYIWAEVDVTSKPVR